jgi:hypothetical protein
MSAPSKLLIIIGVAPTRKVLEIMNFDFTAIVYLPSSVAWAFGVEGVPEVGVVAVMVDFVVYHLIKN